MTLKQAEKHEQDILVNLLEKYEYEFSQYHGWDVEDSGLYGIEMEDEYWDENKKHTAYLIKVDGNLAGFVLVIDGSEEGETTDYAIDEFFIMYKYRRSGIGKKALFEVLDKHRGSWQLTYHPKNAASVNFWEKSIGEYTNGKFKIDEAHPHPDYKYEDGTVGKVMFFQN